MCKTLEDVRSWKKRKSGVEWGLWVFFAEVRSGNVDVVNAIVAIIDYVMHVTVVVAVRVRWST